MGLTYTLLDSRWLDHLHEFPRSPLFATTITSSSGIQGRGKGRGVASLIYATKSPGCKNDVFDGSSLSGLPSIRRIFCFSCSESSTPHRHFRHLTHQLPSRLRAHKWSHSSVNCISLLRHVIVLQIYGACQGLSRVGPMTSPRGGSLSIDAKTRAVKSLRFFFLSLISHHRLSLP